MDDHCDDLLGAYLLNACSEAEAAGVANHLTRCGRCSAAVRRLDQSTELLNAGVAPVAPSAAVRDRVMAQVRAEAALFDAARQDRAVPETGSPAPSPLFRLRLPRVRGWSPRPAAAMACVLLLVAIGAGLTSRLGSSGPRPDVVLAQIKDERASGASAVLAIQGGTAELRVRGLPRPGRGRVYQVWLRKDRQVPRPAGAVFAVDSNGAAQTRLPADIRRFDQVLVTSEPAGGSSLPTRVPVLEVPASA